MRRRVALVCGIVLAASGAALTQYAAAVAERVDRDWAARHGGFVAADLAANASYGVLTEDTQLLKHLVEWIVRDPESAVVGVLFRNSKGLILTRAWRGERSLPDLPPPAKVARQQRVASGNGAELDLYSAAVHGPDGDWLGEADVLLSSARRDALRRQLRIRMLSLTALLSVLAAAIAWWLVRPPPTESPESERDSPVSSS